MTNEPLVADFGECKLFKAAASQPAAIRIEGSVIETFDSKAAFEHICSAFAGRTELKLDLGGVTRMNSSGIRTWLNFVRLLQSKFQARISVLGDVFAEQASMAPGILGQPPMQVDIVRVPYFCHSCGTHFTRDIPVKELSKSRGAPFALDEPCTNCHKNAAADVVPEEYFSFCRLIES